MFERLEPITRDGFAQWVREALNRLYDSAYLQSHPLGSLLTPNGGTSVQRSQNLRRVLLEAIRAMRPAAGVPADSADWRAHRILELRYIEGLSPGTVMRRLALGRSQYFREQAKVLEALTDRLWEQWQRAGGERETGERTSSVAREQLIRLETERLSASAIWETVDVAEFLHDLHSVVEPLARASGVSLGFLAPTDVVCLSADRVILRQAVLSLITYTAQIAREGRLEVGGFVEEGEKGIRVVATGVTASIGRESAALQVCRRLVGALGGMLYWRQRGSDAWEARLAWPITSQNVLLVVDDNEGFIDLFRRYLAGHNWQVVGASSGEEARRILAETRPTVIALDVMMPKEDGWEFLMTIKENADTQTIPVIVCSVLDEPQLALSLGATAYLAKPVTQRALLRALAPWSRLGANQEPGR